jgi:non-ribosomal peptide synthetase-like protein
VSKAQWIQRIAIPLHDQLSLHQALQQVSMVVTEAFAGVTLPNWLDGGAGDLSVNIEWREPSGAQDGVLSASFQSPSDLLAHFHYQNLLSLSKPVLCIGSHWQTLLAHLDGNLNTPISRLPLLEHEEEHLALREWRGNTYSSEGPRQGCLHHFFEAQARSHPERIALFCAGQEISYGELDQQANQLARYLRAKGIGRGSFVAMMLPRSTDVYLSILAILKSGAGYVPIDHECPPDRVDYILQDCQVAALLTTSALAETLSSPACPILQLDRERNAVSCELPEKPEAMEVEAHDVAYVIYTSGSTGRPKGVQIEHHSVCNLVRSESAIFQVQPQDRVYQGFSVAFDASVEEIWLAFSAGAVLVIGTQEMVHAGPALARILTEQRVSVLSCVPTLLSMLDEDIPTIRLLILGGEAWPQDLVSRWWRKGRRVVNTYGPTEATVIATYSDCHPHDKVIIGKPIPNYAVYILDAHLQPAPIGVAGELHIGGVCLSRGYINQPELTREKFIPNPYAGDPGAPSHLYKTGDLVRFTESGAIEFLGRIDAQVKLRGFRVELTEIESVLLQCPGVKGVVVVLREDRQGLQQLAAYVIVQPGQIFNDAAARAFLRSQLPSYMVPSVFMVLAEFPTLPSGKVDRKRLPVAQMLAEKAAHGSLVQVPRTAIEQKILTVWQQLFYPHPISAQDNFFDLGGHSLLAARMVSQLRKDPPMRDVAMLDIYKHPTLEAFARKVEAGMNATLEDATDTPVTESKKESASSFHATPPIAFYACAALQALGTYLLLGFAMLPILLAYHTYLLLVDKYGVVLSLFMTLEVVVLVPFSVIMVASIAAKWILIGRYKAGSHPLWGWYYWRWWMVSRIQALLPLSFLSGTPLLPIYFRLLGAKIGKNVYLGTPHCYGADLLTIGDHSSIDKEAQLSSYTLENGMLTIGPITIGKQCYVGTRSVLKSCTTMQDDTQLDELSLLPEGSTIPSGQRWAGSPARPATSEVADFAQEIAAPTSRLKAAIYGLFYLVAELVLLPIVPSLAALPCEVMLISLIQTQGLWWGVLSTPLLAALFVILLCLEIALAKWVLMGRVKAGRYRVQSFLYVRKWFVDSLMHMALVLLHPLYATLYLPPWFRLLGAKLGKRVEISTVAHITPELLSIDNESFVADSACIGATKVHLGWLSLGKTSIGKRTFIGNRALVPTGAMLGERCLIGCLSVPPSNAVFTEHLHSSWLGSPPVLLPRRQSSAAFPDRVTYQPPWYLYLVRGFIEFFRVTVPSALATVVAVYFIEALILFERSLPLLPLILLWLPMIYFALALAAVLFIVGVKWVVIGKYRPCTKPLWSSFVWRTEMITAFHESFAAPFLLNFFQGTPFLSWYFRLMGSHIGKRVCMETIQVNEFDLVSVGDDAALNLNCTLQTHLFEDRIMKTSHIRVGRNASVGTMAVVLYDSDMQEGSTLNGLSLLMKGETLAAWTHWEGIPAQRGS